MFGITSKDAENLAIGFRIWKKMRVLHIHNSKLDDDKFYTLYEGLKNLNHLGIFLNLENFWKQFFEYFNYFRGYKITKQCPD